MNNEDRLLTEVPFCGFYESRAMNQIEGHLMWWIDDEEIDIDEAEKLKKEIDWEKAEIEYSKAYVDQISDILGIELEFESLESPQFYNFSTDRIFAYIKREDYEKLKANIDDEAMRKRVKRLGTPYDGYIPFYPADYDEWLNQGKDFDYNQIGVLLQVELDTKHKDWEESAIYDTNLDNVTTYGN